MKFLIPLAFLGALVCLIEARPFEEEVDLVEGDMLLTKEQKEIFSEIKNGRVRRAAMKDKYLWPNGIVYYTFGPNLDAAGKSLAKKAMDHWKSKTCLKFKEEKNAAGYIKFQYNGRCQAQVGFAKKAGQLMSVGSSTKLCSFGSAVHELGHGIGFFHEHTRPDRDEFVSINEQNIATGAEGNFKKVDQKYIDSRGKDYDYGSIMHYSRYQGNNKYQAVVTKPLKPNVEIGQRDGLSPGDIAQTKAMYKCDAQGDSHLEVHEDDAKPTPDTGNGPKPGEVEE